MESPKKRMLMDIQLYRTEILENENKCRNVIFSDYIEIGKLDYLTVQDTVEFIGESVEETTQGMKEALEGKYGEFIPEASFVFEEDGNIVSACIFVLSKIDKIPLLNYVMTDPSFQRKGIANNLIKKSMNSLLELGFKKAFLAVKDGNSSAIKSYEKLGFTFRPIPEEDSQKK